MRRTFFIATIFVAGLIGCADVVTEPVGDPWSFDEPGSRDGPQPSDARPGRDPLPPGGSPPPDSEPPPDPDPGPDPPPPTQDFYRPCDPLLQDCEGEGFGCYWDDGEYSCQPGGDGADGDPCETASCQPGLLCVDAGDGPVCAPVCDPDDPPECPYHCHPASGFGMDPDAGVCVIPVGDRCVEDVAGDPGHCDPVKQNCEDGETCEVAITGAGQFVTACLADDGPRDVEEGGFCEGSGECRPGLKCRDFENVCRRYCEVATGRGCLPTAVCSPIEPSFAIGYCLDRCENR